MDCEVLFKGFLSSRKAMYQNRVTPAPGQTCRGEYCGLKMEGAVSTPQFAYHYNGLCGAFDGVYEYSEPLISHFMRAVVGGRASFDSNSPVIYDEGRMGGGPVADLDVTSLYPDAMVRLCKLYGGLTLGAPKVLVPPSSHPTPLLRPTACLYHRRYHILHGYCAS